MSKLRLIFLCTVLLPNAIHAADTAKATFAGGCFWCMEKPFDDLDGVISTQLGYTGGTTVDPDYEAVTEDETGHVEAVQIIYHPEKISYQALLSVFWKNIDPIDSDGQFCDGGEQYLSGIYYHNAMQKKLAANSLKKIDKTYKFNGEIVTKITPASHFYPAEGYHQNYYQKNPFFYKFYRYTCGRDSRLEELWGDNDQSK